MTRNFKKRLVIKKQTKKFLLICGIVLLLITGAILIKNLFSNNGYTAEYGETLKVNESDGYYNFELDVLAIEKNFATNNINGDPLVCSAVKVKIKNLSEEMFKHAIYTKFTLIDSNDKELASADSMEMINGTITNIPSGHETTGYLYFYKLDKEGNQVEFNTEDIAKLKVEVFKKIEKENDKITGDYEQYYIKLS